MQATKSALSHSESTVIGKPMAARLQDQKEKIRQEMGAEMYEKVHRILQLHKNSESEPEAIRDSLKHSLGKNKRMMDLVFNLEMIVFKESLYSWKMQFYWCIRFTTNFCPS